MLRDSNDLLVPSAVQVRRALVSIRVHLVLLSPSHAATTTLTVTAVLAQSRQKGNTRDAHLLS